MKNFPDAPFLSRHFRGAGFNIRIAGNTNSGEVLSYKQSIAENTEAEKGSVITVYFKSNVNVEDG